MGSLLTGIGYDYIRCGLLTSGELEPLIEEGLLGLTFNPAILGERKRRLLRVHLEEALNH